MTTHTLLIMAAGTGGHVIPGLSIAGELARRGWKIIWLGTCDGMENTLVRDAGYALEQLAFGGVRGKGALRWIVLPFALLRAFWQSIAIVRRVKPDIVLGMGGYVTFPGGMMSVLLGSPLVVHEANSVAGLANRALAVVADRVLSGFPDAFERPIRNLLPRLLPKPRAVVWTGNPVRADIAAIAEPETRYAGRSGPLRVLVVGGSLGAQGLNRLVVDALGAMPPQGRPLVIHQSGAKLYEQLKAWYADARIEAEVLPFIADMAARYAWCDVIVCRSGALTVAEVAAAGVAAIFVPLPYAVEDEQTHNARFLESQGAALLVRQDDITPRELAALLISLARERLLGMAKIARSLGRPDATQRCAEACMELAHET